MSEEKGLLTKNLEALAIEGLDKIIDTKGAMEVATDMAIRIFIPVIDNNIADKIRDEIKIPLREAGEDIEMGNYESAEKKVASVLNFLIDLDGINESDEQKVAVKFVQLVSFLIQIALKNRNK